MLYNLYISKKRNSLIPSSLHSFYTFAKSKKKTKATKKNSLIKLLIRIIYNPTHPFLITYSSVPPAIHPPVQISLSTP